MTTPILTNTTDTRLSLINSIKRNKNKIDKWLALHEAEKELPLYSSVDIRDSGFKTSVVDTNIFPAGFNNLCEHGIADSTKYIKSAIIKRVPVCKNILIVAEEHTRNVWYLENLRILKEIIEKAGFNVTIATFLTIQPSFCENANYIQLETATGKSIRIHCFKKILSKYLNGSSLYDLIIMNNDLTTGIPDILKNSKIPIYPSIYAGWHSRLKSHHFCHAKDLIKEFSEILSVDPWMFSCIYSVINDLDINSDKDRKKLAKQTDLILDNIKTKYKEHNIEEKPFVFIKSDYGTYGMSVLSVESSKDILNFNRRNRNKLYKGKSSQINQRFLLQEGVPTIYNINQRVSEVCIYQVENNLVGGFYRSHPNKSQRENLNSQGMIFEKMCPHSNKYNECGVLHDINIFDVYRILARISAIAAHREIQFLEAKRS